MNQAPTFEIRTVEVVNRGIALIPIAVKKRLEREFPGARFGIPPYCYRTAGRSYAVDHGLRPVLWDMQLWHRRPERQYGHLAELLPRWCCDRLGVLKESSVDVVIEAKGFIYSDQWGLGPMREAVHGMRRWKRQGKKVIFLPQAFGPFEGRALRDRMKILLEGADLVFAREKTSYDHLAAISPHDDRIRQAPDFTNLLAGIPPDRPERYRDRIAIIPNVRMLDMTGQEGAARFRAFLRQAARLFTESKQPFCMLLHDGREGDLGLAREAIAGLPDEIEIVREPRPLELKGVIGACRAVIGARYHGLVNALSQGVPALAIGWSHKYAELMRDYGMEEAFIPLNSSPEGISAKLRLLLDDDTRARWKARVRAAAEREKGKAERMWQEVIACIRR